MADAPLHAPRRQVCCCIRRPLSFAAGGAEWVALWGSSFYLRGEKKKKKTGGDGAQGALKIPSPLPRAHLGAEAERPGKGVLVQTPKDWWLQPPRRDQVGQHAAPACSSAHPRLQVAAATVACDVAAAFSGPRRAAARTPPPGNAAAEAKRAAGRTPAAAGAALAARATSSAVSITTAVVSAVAASEAARAAVPRAMRAGGGGAGPRSDTIAPAAGAAAVVAARAVPARVVTACSGGADVKWRRAARGGAARRLGRPTGSV
jgi:hypothetical protein